MTDLSDYPLIYLEHFQNPHNVGVCNAHTHRAVGAVEPGFGCFDQLEITLRICNDTIEEARFRGRLCSGSLASASLLTTLIEGKTVAEALAIEPDTLSEVWGFIPTGKEHSLHFAIATLRDALSSR